MKAHYKRLLQEVIEKNASNYYRAFCEIKQQQVTPEKAEVAAKNLMSNTLHSVLEVLNKTNFTAHPMPEALPQTGWAVGFSDLRNLSHGRSSGAYAVLLENDQPTWGAYLDFANGQLTWAAPGEGVHSQSKLRVANRQKLEHGLLSLPWRTGDTIRLNMLDVAATAGLHTRKTSQPVQDALAVAAGEIDVMLQASLTPAEAMLISLFVQEAGGVVSTLKGQAVTPQTKELIAANSKLHGQFLKQLRNMS
ncbi:MAG: hypothetical protein OXR68_07815 [Alphaproteobacteria bacterium]|nr:hypothetical protein [Alphaproteobacteria bacterium]MDD9920511.1 hypothetical protein [Alphaproteobacteria bacterium]